MTCACKCCCGCCCDGETGSQTLETPCTSPKVFHGKGTICDVCCDLGEIRDDIDSEEDCPGTWVTNGRCLETPCGECETDEDCEWVLDCGCDPEPDPNPFPMIFATQAEAIAYMDTDLPEGCGGCTTNQTICCNGECQLELCDP